MQRELVEAYRTAEENLAKLRRQPERKEAREERQALMELHRRQMVMERNLRHREAQLIRMQQLRDRLEYEQRLRDDELSEIQRAKVRVAAFA